MSDRPKTRVLKIKVVATGRGLTTEAFDLTTHAMPDAEAVAIYHRLFDAVRETLGDPKQDKPAIPPELLTLLDGLTDPDPCRYDHNDYCQVHYCERPCVHEQGQAFLKLNPPPEAAES